MRMHTGKNLLLSTVGFEQLIDVFDKFDQSNYDSKQQNYPPYNIIKKTDNDYSIEIAIAGFAKKDIEILSKGTKLSIFGKVKSEIKGDYLHKGIATREFSHEFVLAETVVVKDADIINGLLTINLENIVPEEQKSRKIAIGKAGKLSFNKNIN